MNMKDLIYNIAQSLVDFPEDVNVTQMDGETVIVLELRVAKDDLGKIIGREGRTARAMRTFLATMAKKANKRVVLEIIE
jgi:predicted RNA-binding protein YlqC (UPF0109 family)